MTLPINWEINPTDGTILPSRVNIIEQPNGDFVQVYIGHHYIAAIVNVRRVFLMNKVGLVDAQGLNYTFAREVVLELYKRKIEQR